MTSRSKCTYGTTATNVAMPDEHTDINEWLGVVKTLILSALDFLSGGQRSDAPSRQTSGRNQRSPG